MATPGHFRLGLPLVFLVNCARWLDTAACILLSVAVSTSYMKTTHISPVAHSEMKLKRNTEAA